MEPMQVAFLTLAALLTGALLPLVFQARSTLRSMQRVLDTSGPHLARTLTDVAATAQEFSVIAGDVTTTLNQVRGTVRTVSAIGSAIGPAVVAAVHAFKSIRAKDARGEATASSDAGPNPGEGPAN